MLGDSHKQYQPNMLMFAKRDMVHTLLLAQLTGFVHSQRAASVSEVLNILNDAFQYESKTMTSSQAPIAFISSKISGDPRYSSNCTTASATTNSEQLHFNDFRDSSWCVD